MGIQFAAGVNLSSSRGIRLGRKIGGGGGGDPLAGIPLALRLQTHSGFGPTPNATTGLYQDYFNGVKFPVITSPAFTDEWTVTIDGGFVSAVFSFGPSDPSDGSIYMGVATGSDAVDALTLSNAINSALPTVCNSSSDASGNVSIWSAQFVVAGTGSSVVVNAPGFQTYTNNQPSVSPSPAFLPANAPAATADGDPVAAWADELGTSGLIATQSNVMLQPVLRFVGSVPVVRGWATGAYMNISSTFNLTNFVGGVSGGITFSPVCCVMPNSGGDGRIGFVYPDDVTWHAQGGAADPIGITRVNGVASTVHGSAPEVVAGSAPAPLSGQLLIGAASGLFWFWNGDLWAILFPDDAADTPAVEAYLIADVKP